MRVAKFELFIDNLNNQGVAQVVQQDASGRLVDPISLIVDEEFVMAFASLFSEAQQTAITTLTTEKATAIQERDAAVAAKETAQAQAANQAATLQAQVATLNTEKSNLQTQVNAIPALQAKISQLLAEVNFDPRVISSDAFFARLTGKELFALGNSKDAMTMQIAALFSEYQSNKWRVEFESPDYTNPIGYLISQGVLTDERAKEISRDATRAEAYRAQ